MSIQIFALSIQLKKSAMANMSLELSDIVTRTLLANLKSFYTEALIWSTPNRIGVWVVGEDHDFLIHSFSGFEENVSYMKVFSGLEAEELFCCIADGKRWRNHNPLIKYSQLCRAEAFAIVNNCLGANLYELVRKGQQELLLQPVIYGGKHSWIRSVSSKDIAKNIIHIIYPELFYRFSIN
jgi:hypothetical protein